MPHVKALHQVNVWRRDDKNLCGDLFFTEHKRLNEEKKYIRAAVSLRGICRTDDKRRVIFAGKRHLKYGTCRDSAVPRCSSLSTFKECSSPCPVKWSISHPECRTSCRIDTVAGCEQNRILRPDLVSMFLIMSRSYSSKNVNCAKRWREMTAAGNVLFELLRLLVKLQNWLQKKKEEELN